MSIVLDRDRAVDRGCPAREDPTRSRSTSSRTEVAQDHVADLPPGPHRTAMMSDRLAALEQSIARLALSAGATIRTCSTAAHLSRRRHAAESAPRPPPLRRRVRPARCNRRCSRLAPFHLHRGSAGPCPPRAGPQPSVRGHAYRTNTCSYAARAHSSGRFGPRPRGRLLRSLDRVLQHRGAPQPIGDPIAEAWAHPHRRPLQRRARRRPGSVVPRPGLCLTPLAGSAPAPREPGRPPPAPAPEYARCPAAPGPDEATGPCGPGFSALRRGEHPSRQRERARSRRCAPVGDRNRRRPTLPGPCEAKYHRR